MICKTYNKGNIYEHTVYFKDKECTIYHRQDGPAIEYVSGRKRWFLNGKPHRIGGPCDYIPGLPSFYAIEGIFYDEEEYWSKVRFGSFI